LGLDFGSVRQPEVSRQLGERQIVDNASNEFALIGAKQQFLDQDTPLRVERTRHAHEDSPRVANGSFDLFVPVLARAQSENSVPLYECLVEIEMAVAVSGAVDPNLYPQHYKGFYKWLDTRDLVL